VSYRRPDGTSHENAGDVGDQLQPQRTGCSSAADPQFRGGVSGGGGAVPDDQGKSFQNVPAPMRM